MLNQEKEDLELVLSQYNNLSQVVLSTIRSGKAILQVIESKDNLNDFLSVLQILTNNLNFCEKDLEKPYHKQIENINIYVHSDNQFFQFPQYTEVLLRVILTQFNNVKYYAYKTKLKREYHDQISNVNPDQTQYLQQKEQLRQFNLQWSQQYPQLTQIKNQQELNYEKLKDFTKDYETHDSSIPDISFHFNSDGSEAILFNLFCEQEIIQKVINKRNDFNQLFYDSKTMHLLLRKERDIVLEDFDALLQQYKNNSIPLNIYLSTKFEQSKKYLNQLGVCQKKNLSLIGTIKNLRLRQDLIEIFECLDKDLEFDDQYQDQYCYAYYNQSGNPFLLEGLIVGPEDTPFVGIIYTLTIKIPEDYPNTPPEVYFNQNILHPNISEKGKICLDILNNKWSPALTIQKVLISIVSLLYEKNLDDVYNYYAKCLYIENPVELKKQVLQQAIFSGCKQVDINYKEISKLSAQSKRKNILQSDDLDEYDCTNEDDIMDNYDYEEDE